MQRALPRASRRESRRGWTLIEMLVTITIMASLTGVAMKLLTTLLRAERTGIEHVTRLTNVSRLARYFRSDVHRAIKVEAGTASPSAPLLSVTLGDQHVVRYDVKPQGVLRTETQPGKGPLVELLRLPAARFRCEQASGITPLLTLSIDELNPVHTLSAESAKTTGKPRTLQISAVIGRDLTPGGKEVAP